MVFMSCPPSQLVSQQQRQGTTGGEAALSPSAARGTACPLTGRRARRNWLSVSVEKRTGREEGRTLHAIESAGENRNAQAEFSRMALAKGSVTDRRSPVGPGPIVLTVS